VRDFRERCRQFMEKTGWGTLQTIATDPDSIHQMRALELVAAYGYGRPTQPVSGDPDPDMPPVRVTVTFDRAEDSQQASAT
jgi:hypothetical protein